MYTYVCIAATPIYTAPQETAPVAQDGQGRLELGQTFAGQPDQHAMIWIASGLGFVPARTVTMSYTFEATSDTPVRQAPESDAEIAEQNGTALIVQRGTQINGAYTSPAWVWLIDGSGFVEASTTRVISDTIGTVDIPASSGGPARPHPGEPTEGTTYVTQSGDTLWDIARHFYGDGSRWHEIYAVPQNREAIGDDPRHIYAGKHLVIPGVEQPDVPVPDEFEWYTVQPGDTLYELARQVKPDDADYWRRLHAINRDIIGADASDLKAGMKIRLPEKPRA
jgi:LysM repeat protein